MLDKVTTGDTIVVTEVSKLSRSTKQFIDLVEWFKENKIQLLIGNMDLDFRSVDINPMVLGMVQMMGVFSELERNMISQRVKQGLENTRLKVPKLGRGETTIKHIPDSFINGYKLWSSKKINKIELSRLTGVSRVTVNKYISIIEQGIS